MNWKRNEGLTLVELMVAILVAAIITTAATTIMLLGLRVNRHSTETAQTQYTARTVLTVLENLASEGTIASVVSTPESWKVLSAEDKILLSYDSSDKAIFTGDGEGKVPLLEDVVASNVVFKDGLLTFALETADGSYTSSVFCRTLSDRSFNDEEFSEVDVPNNTDASRKAFLAALLSQYDSVGGVIQYVDDGSIVYAPSERESYRFYSEWYVGGYDNNGTDSSWNYRTPWCACFISWGLTHYTPPAGTGRITPPQNLPNWYANVKTFENNYFRANNRWTDPGNPEDVVEGDLIFFDWDGDEDPDHIGAVLKTDDENSFIYTIEGNSANTVAIRKYAIDDPQIMGYGVLPWLSE